MGAGVLECDVAFTKDRGLVCRHAQCDLHTTTNILANASRGQVHDAVLAGRPDGGEGRFRQMLHQRPDAGGVQDVRGKMDASDPKATTVEAYMQGTAGWRTDLYATTGTLMTHRD